MIGVLPRIVRNRPLASFVARALILGVLAPAAAPLAPATPAPSAPPATKLDNALDSVKADNIKADIFFIASDAMGGRDTPSPGLQIAARYIRSRLQRLGWTPGAPDGYFYTYKLVQQRLDEVASHVTWDAGESHVALRFGRDYVLSSRHDIDDCTTTADVVFCGTGTDADFERAKPEGRWALCFDPGTELGKLNRAAKSAKAAGLIVAPGPSGASPAWSDHFAEALDEQRDPPVSYPSTREKPRVIFPQMRWTRAAVEHLLDDAHAAANGAAPAVGTVIPVQVTETRKLQGEGGMIDLEDVCGFWPGDDPELSKEVIIVSAHYDHVGTRKGVVYNGADDNGSGTCGLMAIAEALAHYGPMRRSVMLIWVSGEEKGLWGSRAWTSKPWLPEGCRPVCDINIDMIGRNAPDKLLITPTRNHEKHNGLTRLAESLCAQEGFPDLGSADEFYERSDHFNFARMGIPAAFLFSGIHEDYHKPGDKPEKIDNDKIRRVARLVVRMLSGLQTDRLEL
jgi:hypothetical protein